MPPPQLTAAATLYRSAGGYGPIFPQSGSGSLLPGLYPGGYTNCDIPYGNCMATAEATRDVRTHLCSQFPGSYGGAQACYQSADAGFESDLASCQRLFLCASAADCKQSVVHPHGLRCCPPGTQACGTGPVPDCVPECPPPKMIPFRASSCACVCDPFLQECELTSAGIQKVRDPTTCACRCPNPCPPTYINDPVTCECICLPPKEPCPSGCTFLGTQQNCAACDDRCGNNEACCGGQCVDITADPHCGTCGINDCGSRGQTCCGPKPYHCSSLNTNTECGACGRVCKPPRTCQRLPSGAYDCVCPPNSLPCGTELCCTSPRNNCRIGPTGVRECACPPGVAECGADCCDPSEPCCTGVCCNHLPICEQLGPAACHCSQGHCCLSSQVWCGKECCPPARCCNGDCCDPGEVCSQGHCCPSGEVWCGKECCSPARCCIGDCCDPGEVCCGGQKCCRPEECCSAVCRDLQNDRANCGRCGNQCPSGFTSFGGQNLPWSASCEQGQCVCPSNMYACGANCYSRVYPDGSGRASFCCPPGAGYFSGGYACPAGTRCCFENTLPSIEYVGCCRP